MACQIAVQQLGSVLLREAPHAMPRVVTTLGTKGIRAEVQRLDGSDDAFANAESLLSHIPGEWPLVLNGMACSPCELMEILAKQLKRLMPDLNHTEQAGEPPEHVMVSQSQGATLVVGVGSNGSGLSPTRSKGLTGLWISKPDLLGIVCAAMFRSAAARDPVSLMAFPGGYCSTSTVDLSNVDSIRSVVFEHDPQVHDLDYIKRAGLGRLGLLPASYVFRGMRQAIDF